MATETMTTPCAAYEPEDWNIRCTKCGEPYGDHVGADGQVTDCAAVPENKARKARKPQVCRMRKYTCPTCGQIIRAATDNLHAICAGKTDSTHAGAWFNLVTN